MALIKCPECKKKISDQCCDCPQCGYPINNNQENEDSRVGSIGIIDESFTKKKPFYKKVWIWILSGALLATILCTLILLNREIKPRLDKEGNPVFVELTDEVYTNAKKYLGYHINVKGKVFQVIGDNGNFKGVQVWLDPETCEQNLMIYFNNDVEVKQGDYIMCTAYFGSVTKYKNAYNAELHVPLVYSTDLKKSTYMEVVAPATDTIIPENLKQEKLGYSISIDKIEFAEKETRVYATAINNGKAVLNIGDSVIVQSGKQYNSKTNYDADYDEMPYEIVKGASSSGVIVFPPIQNNEFQLTINIHSDNTDEKLGEISVLITETKSEFKTTWPTEESTSSISTPTSKPIQKPTYFSVVGTYVGPEGTITFNSDSSLQIDAIDLDNGTSFVLTGTWVQTDNTVHCRLYDDYGEWTPQDITVSSSGIDNFWGKHYTRQ